MTFAEPTYVYDPDKPITVANYPLIANPRRYYYTQRRGPILACFAHILAGIEDWTPPDDSAEAGIRYGQTCDRPASWSGTCDSDTARDCLPDHYVAFAQGVPGSPYSYNTHGYGIEIGARSTDWRVKPAAWVESTLRNFAKLAAPRHIRYGWKLKHVSASELNADIAAGRPSGYIGHWEVTPSTRSDPGRVGTVDTFPWDQLLGYIAEEIARLKGDPAVLAEQQTYNRALAGRPGWKPIPEDGIPGPLTTAAKEAYMTTLDDLAKQLDRIEERQRDHGRALAQLPRLVWGYVNDKVASSDVYGLLRQALGLVKDGKPVNPDGSPFVPGAGQ